MLDTGIQSFQTENIVSQNSSMSKQSIFLITLSSITSIALLALLIYNILEMNKSKNKICSLQKECIKKPIQTELSPSQAQQLLDSLKNDTVEGFLKSVDDASKQEADTDMDLLKSLMRANIQKQKEEGIKNPVVNIDTLIEDAKSSFKNSDAIVSLIQQKLQKSTDDIERQNMTTEPPFSNLENILKEKNKQIQSLEKELATATPTPTPTPFIDYKAILETRKVEIDKLKSDVENLKERNEKIDFMLKESKKEHLQKKLEIQEIKKSNLSKQEKIKQIKSLVREKDKTIDNINRLLKIKESKIDEKDKKINDINQVVFVKENKINSLTDELKETVPKFDFNRLKEITEEGNEETANALKDMLGLKKLTLLPNYRSSPFPENQFSLGNLKKEEAIISTDRELLLVHQSDSNIVSYDITKDLKNNGNGTYFGSSVWASNTNPKKENGKNISFEWDIVKLKRDQFILQGKKNENWKNWRGKKMSSSNNRKRQYQTKSSQSFYNNNLEIKYEIKKDSSWVRIL